MKKLIAVMAALILICAAGTSLAAGKLIQPLYPTMDLYHLEDRFVTTDIELVEGSTNKAVFTLYDRERFAEMAMRNAAVGDVIETGGEQVTIVSIEMDGPDYVFNKGTDTEMLFCDASDGKFEHVVENDIVPDIRLGSFEIEILDYYPVLDWIDPKTGEILEQPAVRTGEDLRTLLADPEAVGFNTRNVRVLYDAYGMPQMIWRFYSPLQ